MEGTRCKHAMYFITILTIYSKQNNKTWNNKMCDYVTILSIAFDIPTYHWWRGWSHITHELSSIALIDTQPDIDHLCNEFNLCSPYDIIMMFLWQGDDREMLQFWKEGHEA